MPTAQPADPFLSYLKEVALNGVHNKSWTSTTLRNISQVLAELADELDYADELLADTLSEARQ